MEEKLKAMLGEASFAIASLQVQLEAMAKERDALKAQLSVKTEEVTPSGN